MDPRTNIVTVQLTVPALTKLFDDDPEIAVTLRKSVVAAFAKQKIGSILDAGSKALVESEVAKQVGEIKFCPSRITLNSKLLDALKSEAVAAMKDAERQLRVLVTEAVAAEVDRIEGMVREEVKRRVTAEVSDRIKTEVRSRLNAALSAAQV